MPPRRLIARTLLMAGLWLPPAARAQNAPPLDGVLSLLAEQQRTLERQALQLGQQRQELAALRRDLEQLTLKALSPAPAPLAPQTPVEGPQRPPSVQAAGAARLQLSGYLQADALYVPHLRQGEPEDLFSPGLLATPSLPPSQPHTRLSARDTRLGLEARGAGDSVKAIVEVDFFGGAPNAAQVQLSSYEPRLRHAFVDIAPAGGGGSFRLGQTWSALSDPASFGPFYNAVPFGTIFVRQAQIRYTHLIDDDVEFFASIENPQGEVRRDAADLHDERDPAPDLIVGFRTAQPAGHLQAGVVLRKLRSSPSGAETLGWGLSLSGAYGLAGPSGGRLRFQLSGGEGFGRYISDLGDGYDGAVTASGDIRPLGVLAASASYEHEWTRRWRSTIGIGHVVVADEPLQADDDIRRTQAIIANAVYRPLQGLDFAAEITFGEKQTVSGQRARGALYRLATRWSF